MARTLVLRQHRNQPSGFQVHLDDGSGKNRNTEARERCLAQCLHCVAREASIDLHLFVYTIGTG